MPRIIYWNNYSRQWNYVVLGNWISEHIPINSKVAAHSSVPLPDSGITRLSFDEPKAYSLQEFIAEGADFAVTNFDWVTNGFYGWMNSYDFKSWNKPVSYMESEYAAMSVHELSDYSIYSLVKPSLTPESDFIVSKIPNFTILQKNRTLEFKDIEGSWVSQPIDVGSYKGLLVDADIKNGYIYVNFYRNLEDSMDVTKRIATRVSAREKDLKLTRESVITGIPSESKWATIGFMNYNPQNVSLMHSLLVYNALIKIDYGNFTVHQTKIEEGILFPNSQSNL